MKMTDPAELKHMVMSFRVAELQVLLGFAGRNKSGRKHELLQRALQLLQKGCSTPVQIKIRELYRRRFPGKAANPPQPTPAASNSTGYGSYGGASNQMGLYGQTKAESRYGLPHAVPGSISGHNIGYSSSTSAPSSHAHSGIPIHPDVRFKHLPFYDKTAELLKPSSLAARGQSRFQETSFVFHLTPQQAQDVVGNRDLRPSRGDYGCQIQLRFCLLETSCEQEDNFPPSICVRVNGKMATLPNPIPTNKPGMEPKRPSRPVNITPICRISSTVPNQINISWASELGRSYCVAVFLVRKLSSDALLSRLKQSGKRHPDHTRALIKDKLRHDPDSEIATTSLRVSLNCPLGKMRMTVPSRASTCNHLQCFDVQMFLQMNEKKPTWTCPVCDKAAEFSKLLVDGLFLEILSSTESSEEEIEFFEDGSWKPKAEKDKTAKSSSGYVASQQSGTNRSGPAPVIQMIGDSPAKLGASSSSGYEDSSSSSNKAPAQDEEADKDVCLIDLTETDDEDSDDDMPLAASSASSTPSVMSSSPPMAKIASSSSSSGLSSRCVGFSNSPPLISLDTPPQLSPRTPPSYNTGRSPQALPTPRAVAGSSHHYSPHLSLSPHHSSISSRSSLSPRRISPPPAHQGTSHHAASYFPHIDPISDQEFDDFLTLMAGANRAFAHPYYSGFYPFLPSFTPSSHYTNSRSSSTSRSSAVPENLSVRETKNYAMK